ncbi:MAG: winged helix-turn-helix transcriptional regulator [Thermoplasmatota archaeon]
MVSRRILTGGLAAALMISLAGLSLTSIYLIVGDPFDSPEEGGVQDPGVKNGSSPIISVPGDKSADSAPIWLIAVLSGAVLSTVLFLLLAGNIYIRSKRGENMVRNDLLDLITVNPGINLSSIRRELQLSQGAVSYHIMRLEKLGKIFSEKGSKERRYYPSSMGYRAAMRQALEDEVRSILSNDTSRTIVDMLKEGPMSQNELVNELNISPSTVHWHMERMKKAGMIVKEQKGRSVYYELQELPGANT